MHMPVLTPCAGKAWPPRRMPAQAMAQDASYPMHHGHTMHRESQLRLARLGSPLITAHCTVGLGVACGGALGKVLASGPARSATT